MNRTLRLGVQVMILLALFSGSPGCVSVESSDPDRRLVPPEDGDLLLPGEDDGMDADEAAEPLAGACPFGKACSGIGDCPLYMDQNQNGWCDLGVRD